MTKSWQEDFTLPQCVLDAREEALFMEVSWHIVSVFGYETRHLRDELLDELCANFIRADLAFGDDTRANSCRAFARLINDNEQELGHIVPKCQRDEWLVM